MCADQFFCSVLAATVHVGFFPTLVHSGSQSLPCRSLRSMANHFVQFSRRLCLLQHMSASPRRCMATASSAVQVIAEWRWPHRPPESSAVRPRRRRHAGREDGQDAMGACPSNFFMWTASSGPRHSACCGACTETQPQGLCRLSVDYGNGRHCPKLDKQSP